MEQQPLVSVLMTAYNREKYIAEAIESVLAQTYEHWELLIVDDGSKDATVSIAQSFVKQDPRIRLHINEKNLKDYPNRNKAASLAKGELLMYVDSDDTINADAIAYVVRCFKEHPGLKFATIYQQKDIEAPLLLSSKDAVYKHFFQHTFLRIGPGGTVHTRSFFNKIGGFPTKYGPANDMFHNVRVASLTQVLLMPYDYLNYRIHDGQEANNAFSYLYNGYLYFDDLMRLSELPLSATQKNYLSAKNKRRFIVNSVKFFFKAGSIPQCVKACQLAGFTFSDFIRGVFHK